MADKIEYRTPRRNPRPEVLRANRQTAARPPLIPRLWTAQEVAAASGLSLPRIYELAREGQMPVVRFGRSMRFDPQAVADWIAAGGTGATEP